MTSPYTYRFKGAVVTTAFLAKRGGISRKQILSRAEVLGIQPGDEVSETELLSRTRWVKKGRVPRSYLLNGASVTTVSLAKRIGVSTDHLGVRIKILGIKPGDEISGTDLLSRSRWERKGRPSLVFLLHRIPVTAKHLAEKVGISRNGMLVRIRILGIQPGDEVSGTELLSEVRWIPPTEGTWVGRKDRGTKYLYHGDLLTIREIALKLGITPSGVYSRIKVRDYKPGSEIGEWLLPSRLKEPHYLLKGEEISQKDLAKKYKLTSTCLHQRFKRLGLSPGDEISGSEALSQGRWKRKQLGRGPDKFLFKGTHRTIVEIAGELKLKPVTLWRRLHTLGVKPGKEIREEQVGGYWRGKLYLLDGLPVTTTEVGAMLGVTQGAIYRRILAAGVKPGQELPHEVFRPNLASGPREKKYGPRKK